MSEVKEQLKSIDLLDYVESNWSFDKEVKVSSGVQLSPCPMCGHNDCFTVYTKTNRVTSCVSSSTSNVKVPVPEVYAAIPPQFV